MSPERGEQQQPLTLTQAQEIAAREVLSIIRDHHDRRTLVVLEGLSGVGKSCLLGSINNAVNLNNGKIVEPEEIKYDSSFKTLAGFSGHFVTTKTIGEWEQEEISGVAAQKIPGIEVKRVFLKGMSEQETEDYVASVTGLDINDPNAKMIIQYSLGIPHLANLLSLPGITEEGATKVTAKYLKLPLIRLRAFTPDSARCALQPYLQMDLPDGVLKHVREMLGSIYSDHIYDDLHEVLQQRNKLMEAGVIEESPLFIAPESEDIYDTMLRSNGRAHIDIFVPELTQEDLLRLQQAFGYTAWGYDGSMAARIKMFYTDYRKVQIWHRDQNGRDVFPRSDDSWFKNIVPEYVHSFKKGLLGMNPTQKQGLSSFLIHSHEHEGMTFKPAKIGWVTESLLQQRGISYFVNNDTYDASYIYNPETRKIEFLPKRFYPDPFRAWREKNTLPNTS